MSRKDVLAEYYPLWHQNCLDSIQWLAGKDPTPPICQYGPQEIEWLVDYYEQQALIYYCLSQQVGVL